MKIALCTTTIHVPHALKLMRKCSDDVMFFATGDRKSPDEDIVACLEQCGAHAYYDYDWQAKLGYKCHDLIGENTLARRNIAFLEALKWGADVIYSWDNDNLPVSTSHFDFIQDVFAGPRNGIQVGGYAWFDPGSLLIPHTRHRGYPHNMPQLNRAESVIDAKIGVAAGLVIGDPDIDSITRIEKHPDIGSVHILGSVGVVVDPKSWTVWNSQNTAVARALIPSWFMAPGCNRHDDIFASLITQRVMRERGYQVHFGNPIAYQSRNEHDLLVDLRAEIDGMSNVLKMATLLDGIVLLGKNVIDDTRRIYETLEHAEWYPKQACTVAFAWLEDCESIL